MTNLKKENTSLARNIVIVVVSFILTSCAAQKNPATFSGFLAKDLNEKISSGTHKKKFDNLILIMDTSATMNQGYLYEAFDTDVLPTLFEVEKEIAKRLNKTLPDLDINAGIRTFGFGSCQSWGFSAVWLPLGPYNKTTFSEALNAIKCAGGGSPMDYAIEQAGEQLESVKGRTAMIIISDGETGKSPLYEVVEIRQKYDKRVCIYTIALSNDKISKMSMRRLSAFSGCGFTIAAEEIASSEDMADYVERVFLTKE